MIMTDMDTKRLKVYTVCGILFVMLTGSLAHFVYGWTGQNLLAGLFFPVNESTWEHMKLIFFPVLLYSLFMGCRLKEEYPCVRRALAAGILAGTYSVPVFFYTYTGILGSHNMVLDIAVFVLSVFTAFGIIYRLSVTCRISTAGWLSTFVIVTAAAFFLFSYDPPDIGLFADPTAAALTAG
jgi:hypothetical protein